MLRTLARVVVHDELLDRDRECRALLERAIVAETRLASAMAEVAALATEARELRSRVDRSGIADLVEEFKTHALSEQPYPNNEVPERDWLSPAYAELRRDAR